MGDYDDSLADVVEFLDRASFWTIEFLDRANEINAYALAHTPPRVVRDRGNPMEEYKDGEFLRRYRFSKRAVQQLLAKFADSREYGRTRLPAAIAASAARGASVLRSGNLSSCDRGPGERFAAHSVESRRPVVNDDRGYFVPGPV
ncbi:hypothetical protein HPB48_003835 [Haemaphysalis longicornis]|uniref:Uncharacterized protein n=1 Tax=Haemaphysalis longicornis TaxID=44386 RepID=A0A9J6FBF6_HAELO|nr:hypothetical protein HPB48_003835 [Haemaphysalis longicornis]